MKAQIEKAISELKSKRSKSEDPEYLRGLNDAIVVLNNLILSSGVFDINGEELCEGDTVRLVLGAFKESDYTYKISFENGCFWLNHAELKSINDAPLRWGGIYRVEELGFKMKKIQS